MLFSARAGAKRIAFEIALGLGIWASTAIAGARAAENLDDSLIPFAVNVHRTPMQTWGPGYGIYLGRGLFITAAHVVGRSWWTRPKIAIAGQEYPTRVVKEGSFEGTDVTALAVDPFLQFKFNFIK